MRGNRGMLGAMVVRSVPEPDEDAALLERARRGDRTAFEALVKLHLPRVWRVVWRVVRDDSDAEDVSQEVFLTAWRSLPGFRGDCRFSTWIHQIAATRALNHVERAAERLRRASVSLKNGSDGEPGRSSSEVAALHDASPSPLEALASRERMKRLADCFRSLPGAWRLVVALRDGEARSYGEIAEILGLELGTVRSRLARARFALRECVEGRAP